MGHTVTGKLNKPARQFQNQSGMTFFVDIGEAHFNHKTKQKGYTNYSAALFAKDNQISFYTSALIEGAIVSVGGSGLIIDMPDDPQYSPRLQIQDARLEYVYSGQAPQQPAQQQQQGQRHDSFEDTMPF